MFLHLGNDYMIHKDKVIAILDLETVSNNPTSLALLNNLQKKEGAKNIAENCKGKSFIISDGGNFISPISSTTLLKRSSKTMIF